MLGAALRLALALVISGAAAPARGQAAPAPPGAPAASAPPAADALAPEALACAPAAPALEAALELAFPEQRAGRTRVEGRLVVAGAAAGAGRAFRLDGAAARGEHRVEQFRYRFAPAAAAGPVRLDFVRLLPAGRYRLELRLLEETSGRCWSAGRELDVPAPGGAAAGGDGLDALAAAPSVRLFYPAGELLTGKVRFDADVRDAGVASLAFELDGRRVLTRSRPPWSVELDLGRAPRLHRLAAIAADAAGAELARDEVLVNAGPHRFAVRLALSPPADGRQVARAEVDLPEDEALDRLELRVDGALAATLYQPPFEQELELPAGAAWVRAVAFLAGGGAAEAVRLVGGTGPGESLDVDFVELFATVLDRGGHPVDDLRAEEVELLEDGRPQALRRFERVGDVPIHAAVMLDTSGSMVEELGDAVAAALRFFQEVLTPSDRAAVITFANAPHLAVRFTGRLDRLAGGVAGLRADGETALYDSLAFALHYFSGLTGKRAIVLISDGADTRSRTRFEDVLDFARRTGVAIYTVGLALPSSPPEPGMVLERLARETGGRAFRVDRAARLGFAYHQIERELRAQWLLAYQSDAPGGTGFRKVEVRIRRPGCTARTAAGYYP